MDDEVKGACIDIYRNGLLDTASKSLLTAYADYLDKEFVSFSIRFLEPQIRTEYEESQIIKAIGYRPVESIVICGLLRVIFYAAEEIMRKYGGYLQAGAPEDIIPTIQGKAYKIVHEDMHEPTELSQYHLLDVDFVANYFNVRRDPAVLNIFSLERFSIGWEKINDLLSRESKN